MGKRVMNQIPHDVIPYEKKPHNQKEEIDYEDFED